MAKALYRKYRSTTLDAVIGQKHVTDILARAIATDKISHAYLLTGPRGVGKTSIARILAHEINHLKYDEDAQNLDIIEIDAASNNGVEDVRDLREKVQIAPVSAAKKVYIIDEVHMLSKAAFNALLKTLEEPPEHVVFILATTNVEKLPATIISRTQRFSFRSIGIPDAVKHLKHIATEEKIKITDEALELIAERGDGSFRDSISLLDQLSSLTDDKEGITTSLIETSLGLAPQKIVTSLLDAVEARDVGAVVSILDSTFDEGINSVVLASQLTTGIRRVIAEKPQFIPLLDALLDVAKNSQPQLKLLSVLGLAATPKQVAKSVALASPVLEVTATIAELEKRAIEEHKTDTPSPASKIEPAISTSTSTLADSRRDTFVDTSLSSAELATLKQSSKRQEAPTNVSGQTDIAPSSDVEIAATPQPLDWAKLIEYTRQNHVALYSVLSKCHYVLDGSELTIYAANKFYKKKLDDTKYSVLLSECLQKNGVYGLNIHTIPTAPPPTDSQALAVAAIMGGGEEVSVEA